MCHRDESGRCDGVWLVAALEVEPLKPGLQVVGAYWLVSGQAACAVRFFENFIVFMREQAARGCSGRRRLRVCGEPLLLTKSGNRMQWILSGARLRWPRARKCESSWNGRP